MGFSVCLGFGVSGFRVWGLGFQGHCGIEGLHRAVRCAGLQKIRTKSVAEAASSDRDSQNLNCEIRIPCSLIQNSIVGRGGGKDDGMHNPSPCLGLMTGSGIPWGAVPLKPPYPKRRTPKWGPGWLHGFATCSRKRSRMSLGQLLPQKHSWRGCET